MSDRTDRMIGGLMPVEQEDEHVVALMETGAAEFDLIEGQMLAIRDQAWPHRADESLGLLARHEREMLLPVAPVGLSVAQRQGRLRAQIGRRRDGRARTWAQRMDDLVGVGLWTVEKNSPGANQITVTLNVPASSGLGVALAPAIERFTPSHVEVIVTYAPTFIIGESELGEEEL